MLITRSIQISIILAFSVTAIQSYFVDTFYGKYATDEIVIQELIENEYVQRLKKIHQYGPRQYAIKKESYTRFDHSLGVMYLLHRFGASTQEQIAGLLHDVSHTVFSHVGDLLFNRKQTGEAYQDEIHGDFLKRTSLNTVLIKYGFTAEIIAENKEQYHALEQDLPNICADRLEYNLQGGYVHGILTKEDIAYILDNLRYEENQWYFSSIDAALRFAQVPLVLMEEVWSSPANNYIYDQTSTMLMRALSIGILTDSDIHYGTDDAVWQRLSSTQDDIIQTCYRAILEHEKHIIVDEQDFTKKYKAKFRGIDPLVKIGDTVSRLTELDETFSQKYHAAQRKIEAGWSVKIV